MALLLVHGGPILPSEALAWATIATAWLALVWALRPPRRRPRARGAALDGAASCLACRRTVAASTVEAWGFCWRCGAAPRTASRR